jgi:hypothetical protein
MRPLCVQVLARTRLVCLLVKEPVMLPIVEQWAPSVTVPLALGV